MREEARLDQEIDDLLDVAPDSIIDTSVEQDGEIGEEDEDADEVDDILG